MTATEIRELVRDLQQMAKQVNCVFVPNPLKIKTLLR